MPIDHYQIDWGLTYLFKFLKHCEMTHLSLKTKILELSSRGFFFSHCIFFIHGKTTQLPLKSFFKACIQRIFHLFIIVFFVIKNLIESKLVF